MSVIFSFTFRFTGCEYLKHQCRGFSEKILSLKVFAEKTGDSHASFIIHVGALNESISIRAKLLLPGNIYLKNLVLFQATYPTREQNLIEPINRLSLSLPSVIQFSPAA